MMSGEENSAGKDVPYANNLLDIVAPPVTSKWRDSMANGLKRCSTGKRFAMHHITKHSVNTVFQSIAPHWYDLGLELLGGSSSMLLDEIAKEDKHDPMDYCAKMLAKWMNVHSSNATWYQLIQGIKAIKLHSVASDLEQQLFLGDTGEHLKKYYKVNCQTNQEQWQVVGAEYCPIEVLITTNEVSTSDPSCVEKINRKSHSEFLKLTDLEVLLGGNDEPKLVLIEGAPGTGKTMLSKEICHNWSVGKMLSDLLFLVYLRDPAVQKITTLPELISCFIQPTQKAKQISDYLQNVNGKGVLFILDGYDEMPSKLCFSSFSQDLISGKCLTKARVIVTSRPLLSASLRPLVHRRIEILGFDKTSKRKYITKALQDSSESTYLLKYLRQHPIIDSVCYVPLTLSILVNLFKMQPESLPTTLTDLYKSFIVFIVRRQLKGVHNDNVVSEVNHLPVFVYEMVLQLAEIAFQNLMRGKIVFTKDDLPEVLVENPTCYGLLQSVEHYSASVPTCSFNFLHFSVQEYLAAFYISNLTIVEVGELLVKSFLSFESNLSVRLFNVWVFYCGITGGNCTSLRCYLAAYGQPTSQQSISSKDLCSTTDFLHRESSYHTSSTRSQYATAVYANTLLQSSGVVREELSFDHGIISQDILKDPCKVLYLFNCFQEAQDSHLCEILSKSFHNTINLNAINLKSTEFVLPEVIIRSLCLFLSKGSTNKYKELNLFRCHIGDHGMYRLSQSLCGNEEIKPTIETINFMDNNLTEASMSLVVDLVNHMQPINLKLGNNHIQCVDVISDIMFSSINSLDLWDCEITAPAGAPLAKMITFLTELNVGNNKLGDDGAELLSKGIRKSLKLQVLNLNNNNIGSRGAVAIIYALSSNVSLMVLNISNNAIGEEGATAIAKTFGSNLTLKKFLLCGDSTLDEDLAIKILESLSQNVTITKIGLPTRFANGNRIKNHVENVNIGRVKYHDPKLVLGFAN